MATIEKEIQEALHAKPATGSLGDERLDFFVRQSENFISEARAEIERIEPKGPYDADKSIAYEGIKQVIQRATWQVQAQLGSIDESVKLTGELGERLFRSNNSRPQNISDEVIGRRWASFKSLLDSLAGGAIIQRIREELQKVSQPYGGDELSKFLLRDGENLIRIYLESRKVSLDPYYEAVRATSQIYETDIIEGCNTLLLVRRLEKAWPPIRQRLMAQLGDLSNLLSQKALSWQQRSSGGVKVQSSNDGSVNVSFASLEEFRRWVRTPH